MSAFFGDISDMKRLLLILPFLFLFGCKPTQYVPLDNQTVIVYHDSTIWHNDTIHVAIEKEAYHYHTALLDTLRMETAYAYSTAYVDTTNHLLKGHMASKQVDLPVVYKWKERVITNDTTILKEVPIIHTEYVENKADKVLKNIWMTLCLACAAMLVLLLIMRKLKL